MRARGEVSDGEWGIMEPLLRFRQRVDGRGGPPADTRAVLNGVLWILRTGGQWRELPEKYLPYQTVHGRFQQWVRSGQLEKALRALAEKLREDGKLDLDEGFIDGSFASAKKGPRRGKNQEGQRDQDHGHRGGKQRSCGCHDRLGLGARIEARRRNALGELPQRTDGTIHRRQGV